MWVMKLHTFAFRELDLVKMVGGEISARIFTHFWVCAVCFCVVTVSIQGICFHKFTDLSGQISSPKHPDNYSNSSECWYLIHVPEDFVITLRFAHFDLEPEYRLACRFDFFQVFDGSQSNLTSLGKFCGADLPAPVQSTSNVLLIKFVTDDSYHYAGFRVDYTTKREDCRQTFTQLSGQFESPNFPQSYPSSIECHYYLIEVPFEYTITLVFSHFELEPKYRGDCRFDFLEVFDGSNSTSPSLGKFCGAASPAPINSTYSSLLVKFVTDDSEEHTGFRVNYTTNRVCNFKYTELGGHFWSYYLHQHQHLQECNYLIQVPVGYTITLHFKYIHLLTPYKECEAHSYLEVFAGTQTHSPSLGRFCGSIAPAPIYSTTNSLLVKFSRPRFSSDKDGPYFFAQYSTQKAEPEIPCGIVSTLVSSQECFSKILGGRDAGRRDFPWQVLIEGKGFICGGSLVHKDWVMTAAHCVRGQNGPLPRKNFRVHLGIHRRNRKDNRHVQTKTVVKIVAHQNFDYRTLDNDLALVRLNTEAVINNYVNLLCLPSEDRHSRMMTSKGTHGMVAGWGLSERLHETSVLKKACLPVVSNKTCQQKTSFQFSDNMFCAGTGSKDSCRGDSGGAFAVYDRRDKRWFQGGVVSWGTSSACIRRNYGIYVRVDRYVDWINEVVSSL